MMANESIIDMERIWTCFGETVVHRDISLRLRRGRNPEFGRFFRLW